MSEGTYCPFMSNAQEMAPCMAEQCRLYDLALRDCGIRLSLTDTLPNMEGLLGQIEGNPRRKTS